MLNLKKIAGLLLLGTCFATSQGMAAGGSGSIIVVFLSLDQPAQPFGNKYQADTSDKSVNRVKGIGLLPREMAVLGYKKINEQKNHQ